MKTMKGYYLITASVSGKRSIKNRLQRFNAYKMIVRISRKYQELSQEIGFLLQDHYLETLSPGVRHSLIRMINRLGNIDIAPPE